jgi:signal transduction histidine kinase
MIIKTGFHAALGGCEAAMTELDLVSAESPRLSLAGFANYLAAQQSVITEQWLILVRRDPRIETADRLPQQQLIDHMPRLFKELCDFLRTRDASNLFGEVRRDAQNHGELRWQDGYRIDELLWELEAFRHIVASSVFHYRDQDANFNGKLEVSASVLVHQFFAEISVASARQFVREQDNVTRSTVQQLTSTHLELGRANAKLEQTLSERDRASTMVAHEIRNFLQSMSGRLVKTSDYGMLDFRGFLNQLLEYAELTGKATEIAHARFEPVQLFAELVAKYKPLVEQKGLDWVADASTAPAWVVGDPAGTKRIAEILLINAIDNTQSGQVTLRFAAYDLERWAIRIEDTGAGLSNEASERLFSGSSSKDQLPAQGIGLAIAKDLIARLGGTFNAVTQSTIGTRFDVSLPNEALVGDH